MRKVGPLLRFDLNLANYTSRELKTIEQGIRDSADINQVKAAWYVLCRHALDEFGRRLTPEATATLAERLPVVELSIALAPLLTEMQEHQKR